MVTETIPMQKTAFNHLAMRCIFGNMEEKMSELGFKRINLLAGSRMGKER